MRFTILTTLCALVLTINLCNGAVVLPGEYLLPSEMEALRSIFPKDFNYTDFQVALRSEHPHARLNVVEVIRLYEYAVEIHTVKTEDDYILEIQRITGNKMNPKAKGKPVVFLQHGLLCSAMDWVLAGPERGLAFLLADAGYDVWLGNARGSKYSRKHKRLTVDDHEYWNFSWHEIGIYDLPAMINEALNVTGQKKLTYIGHSQGSTAFFVMASELPEYNNKINIMFSLAPVAYCSHMFSPVFQFISRMVKPITLVMKYIGLYEFKPTDAFTKKFTSLICDVASIFQPLCTNVIFLFTGFDLSQWDPSLVSVIAAHVPAGAGVNQFVHYGQIIHSGQFQQYDLGAKGNMQKYKSISPPSYNLRKVKAPVSLHYSVNDWLSNPADVHKLYSELANPVGKFRVNHDQFNHLDYLWAKDVKTLLYDKVTNIMRRYQNKP